MTGPIRTVLIGLEAVENTEAATLYTHYVEGEPDSTDNFARQLIEVQNGTVEGGTLKALGPRSSALTFNSPLFYDTMPRLLIPFCGPPTTTHTAAHYVHTFKRSTASAPPTATVYFYDNVRWQRMLGAVGNTCHITQTNIQAPMMELAFLGRPNSTPTTPTVPAVVSAYDPAGWRALEVDVAALPADALSYDTTLDNQRVGRWTGNAGATVARYTRQRVKTTGNMDFDYLAYPGSQKEKYDTEEDLVNVDIKYIDPSVDLDTGVHPEIEIKIPDAIMSNATLPTVDGEKTQHAEWTANYDATAATGMQIIITNGVADYVPD